MGGGSATTLKSSDNSVILNADPNGEIDIRRNNYICRQEQYFEGGDPFTAVAVSAIFRPSQEQDVPQNRRAQTFVLTSKNGFYARVTIIAKDTITDPNKDITIFAEGDTSSNYIESVEAFGFDPSDEQDAFVVTLVIYGGGIVSESDENDRIYVSTDGDNTFVDFVHDYGYVEQNYDELYDNNFLFYGGIRDVLPSLAYIDAKEELKVNDATAYINSPKIVPFHVALFDAFNGGGLIYYGDNAVDETVGNANLHTLPLFHKVSSSQDAYDFYTSSYVIVKNLTELTDEQLFNALQPSQDPTTFVLSTHIYDGRYHCTFYDYSTSVH